MIPASKTRLALFCIPLILLGCNSGKGTEPAAEPPVIKQLKGATGQLFLADGRPAAGAEVKVYRVDHVPGADAAAKTGALSYSTRTDAEGRYAIDSLPRGEYNILADKDGQASYQDSVYITGADAAIDPDTLLDAGLMQGTVRLQPNHNPESATVQALGTNVYANTDPSGKFTLGPLAKGNYSVRIVTTYSEYTPLFTTMRVRVRHTDTLGDTLRPVFTGIPVVTGLKIGYDTAAAIVHLSWDKVNYPLFQSYEVLRSFPGDPSQRPDHISVTADILISEDFSAAFSAGLESLAYEYRIKVINKSDEVGPSFGHVNLDAPNPSAVKTSLSFDGVNKTTGKPIAEGKVSIGDSLRLNFWFSNPHRNIKKVELFSFSDRNPPLKSVLLDPPTRQGSVSLGYTAGMLPGEETLRARVTDDSGAQSEGAWVLQVQEDKPTIRAAEDTLIPLGGRIKLHGTAADGYGRIVKMEWDIGATGKFTSVPGGDTAFAYPGTIPQVVCVFRVTDDDGQTALDTTVARYGLEWSTPGAEMGEGSPRDFMGGQMLEFQGKLWMLGGEQISSPRSAPRAGIELVSLNGIRWDTVSSALPFDEIVGHQAVVFKDRIWVIGGRIDGTPEQIGPTYRTSSEVWSSPDGKNWELMTTSAFPQLTNFTVAAFNGKMMAIGGTLGNPSRWDLRDAPANDEVWESEDGITWNTFTSTQKPPNRAGQATAVFAGKLWLVSGFDPVTKTFAKDIWSSPDGVNWVQATLDGKFPGRNGANLLVKDGRLWLIGGNSGVPVNPEDPAYTLSYYNTWSAPFSSDVWSSADGTQWTRMFGSELPHPTFKPSTCIFKDRIFMFGGQDPDNGNSRDLSIGN